MQALRIFLSLIFLPVLLLITSCGESSGSGGYSNEPLSELETEFRAIAVKHRIPFRLLLAVGYVESRLNPKFGYANYKNNESTNQEAKRGLLLTESAYGVTRDKLGLAGNAEGADNLLVQTEAYARLLRIILDKQQANLPDSPKSSDELFQWIWEIARIHRGEGYKSKNVLVTFAKEVGAILNKGFVWQQNASGEVIRLKVANPKFDEASLNQSSREALTLRTDPPEDIFGARFLPLSQITGTEGNRPEQVKVIHCPLSLSACLELQTLADASQVRLGAHYVIPRNEEIFQTALQVTPHNRSVTVTDERGNNRRINDKIVVMLVGNSGKVVNGQIEQADPSWLTHWQLTKMAEVISGVCSKLERDGVTTVKECTQVSGRAAKKIFFRKPKGNFQTWGDIPDYDEKIFGSYLENSSGDLTGAAKFEQPEVARDYFAGQDISLILNYQSRAKLITIETMVRCRNGKLRWASVLSKQVRGNTRTQLAVQAYSKGPNSNGSHFYRAKVYGNNLNLLGWDYLEVYVQGFEEGPDLASYEECD